MARPILIKKVWETGFGQKHITIPHDNPEGIQTGDFVAVTLVKPKLIDGKCVKCKKLYVDHTVKELYKHGLIQKVL